MSYKELKIIKVIIKKSIGQNIFGQHPFLFGLIGSKGTSINDVTQLGGRGVVTFVTLCMKP